MVSTAFDVFRLPPLVPRVVPSLAPTCRSNLPMPIRHAMLTDQE